MDGLGVQTLLEKARNGESEPLGRLLGLYSNYLTILATTQLNQKLRRRVNPSDLVQETMLAAHRDFATFRGSTEKELLAWLRRILINSLHHAIETHLTAKRRDIRREISLDQVSEKLDRSAAGFARRLADPGPSPSSALQHCEDAAALADQLAKLRPQYRDVVVLRNLQGLSFDEIADCLGTNSTTVRIWWLRAIEKLKQLYDPIH